MRSSASEMSIAVTPLFLSVCHLFKNCNPSSSPRTSSLNNYRRHKYFFSLSSAFTHIAIWPLSEPTRKPFLKDLIELTPKPSRSLNAQLIYWRTSFS
jgi:hypothetical protein